MTYIFSNNLAYKFNCMISDCGGRLYNISILQTILKMLWGGEGFGFVCFFKTNEMLGKQEQEPEAEGESEAANREPEAQNEAANGEPAPEVQKEAEEPQKEAEEIQNEAGESQKEAEPQEVQEEAPAAQETEKQEEEVVKEEVASSEEAKPAESAAPEEVSSNPGQNLSPDWPVQFAFNLSEALTQLLELTNNNIQKLTIYLPRCPRIAERITNNNRITIFALYIFCFCRCYLAIYYLACLALS